MITETDKEILKTYFNRLWPICRSITGNGLRSSFKILSEIIPFSLTEIPTGTKVFDWEIPKEWNINDAYLITPDGEKICQFKINNLHILNYSIPVQREIEFEELMEHLFFLPDMPDVIPYKTSYYKEAWGFCLSYNDFLTLPRSGVYKVFIDSSLERGSLTYGESFIKGNTEKELFFSSYLCHPSMANNELSGPLVQAFLYRKIRENLKTPRYSYRFLLAPETIGVIAYLDQMGSHLKNYMEAGYVITCAGDPGPFNYKRSKNEANCVNRIAEHVLKYSGESFSVRDFSVGGSDERQYCSPGFNLPVGSLMRTPYKEYPQYHTSADNLDVVTFEALKETVEMYYRIVCAFEANVKYRSTIQYCEPQLGKRGLYTELNSFGLTSEIERRLHLLSWADGTYDLIDIAEKMNCSVLDFADTVKVLKDAGLIVEV